MNIESFLRNRGVSHSILPHRSEYTASRTAQSLHVSGKRFAKTVVLNVDNQPVLVVLPANHTIDLELVRQALGAQDVRLIREAQLPTMFPDCELGAIPPFGSQYHMTTVMDDSLAREDMIVFDGNTHDCAISMSCADYEALEHPRVAHVAN